MNNDYQEFIYEQVRSFVQRQRWWFEEKVEINAKRIDIRVGADSCVTKVYTTGKIQNQASPQSRLKIIMDQLKAALEKGDAAVAGFLPFEIESFPDTLAQRIPNIDPVIIAYLTEAIACAKGELLCASAFLLGAASEKAVWLMIDAYGNAIGDEKNRAGFKQRTGGKFISRAYDEFRNSFKSCQTKPADAALQEWEVKIDAIFQFYRLSRNEVGHPQIVPHVEKGALIANMGQFVTYVDTIYQLINYFANNVIVV
jgi:hypothetical protein